MKKIIVGIIIFILIITPGVYAININVKEKSEATSLEADVPVWKINDQWIYQIDNIYIYSDIWYAKTYLSLTIGELPLTVISTVGDFYTLQFQTSISGYYKMCFDNSNGFMNLTFSFSNLKLSGDVKIEKSTLGIKELSVAFNREKFMLEIEQSYFTLPSFLQKISTKLTMSMTGTFTTPLSLLTFPLSTGISWDLASTNVTINGKIQSVWLYLLNFMNKIAKLFGKEFLPPEVSALLPVIHIEDEFKFPANDSTFFCLSTENITVPAGTYNAYTISFLEGKAQCYYAPTAGNVIKITGNLEKIIHGLTNFNMELLSTNYS
jgi:hypothetical protein